MDPEVGGLLAALFVVVVILGVLAVCWDIVLEVFMNWEGTWNHPKDNKSDQYPMGWAPRLPWLCGFADWITAGRCHD